MFAVIKNFINYWYFRYLLVTELYMVEKWERAMFHIVIFILLAIAYLFNTTVMLGLVRMATRNLFISECSTGTNHMGAINSNNYDL